MQNLWLAIVIYSVGLAAVLHVRPALMFHPNGAWKEFGYQRDARHTLFPFWLFAITWAIVSYAVAAVGSMLLQNGAVVAAAAASSVSAVQTPVAYEDEEEGEVAPEFEMEMEPESEPIPVSRTRSRAPRKTTTTQPRPGYYVLDPKQSQNTASGLRRYIYYGPKRPEGEF